MKLKTMLISLMVVLSFQFLNPAFSIEIPTNNLDIVTTRYLEAIEAKAEYKARKESLESELNWLRIESIALKIFICYLAVR